MLQPPGAGGFAGLRPEESEEEEDQEGLGLEPAEMKELLEELGEGGRGTGGVGGGGIPVHRPQQGPLAAAVSVCAFGVVSATARVMQWAGDAADQLAFSTRLGAMRACVPAAVLHAAVCMAACLSTPRVQLARRAAAVPKVLTFTLGLHLQERGSRACPRTSRCKPTACKTSSNMPAPSMPIRPWRCRNDLRLRVVIPLQLCPDGSKASETALATAAGQQAAAVGPAIPAAQRR